MLLAGSNKNGGVLEKYNANTCERKALYEIFFGKKPDVSNLNIHGSRVFVKEAWSHY